MTDETIILKRVYIFTDSDPSDQRVISEVARDSWPKMVPEETEPVGEENGAVFYRGPVDKRLYDDDDVEMMHQSDTVTVVSDE